MLRCMIGCPPFSMDPAQYSTPESIFAKHLGVWGWKGINRYEGHPRRALRRNRVAAEARRRRGGRPRPLRRKPWPSSLGLSLVRRLEEEPRLLGLIRVQGSGFRV